MENKIRNSNIELLRILCMFFIIMHHSFYHSQISANISNINLYIFYCMQFLGKVANNLFIIITGYYMVGREINKKSLKNIIFKTIFYSYVILIIYLLVTHDFNYSIILHSVMPLTTVNNWFVIYYILLYISIPIINILISNLTQKQLKNTIFALIVILSILPMLNLLEHNYSTYLWFICVYMIGAYIKKYDYNLTIKKEASKILMVSLIGFFVFIALTEMFKLELYNMVEVNSLITLIIPFFIFILFINKKEWYNSKVNYISSSTLGIYLIHENIAIREHLWKVFKIEKYLPYSYFFIYEIGVILLIFCACLVIDKLLEKLVFKPISNKFFTNKEKKKNF